MSEPVIIGNATLFRPILIEREAEYFADIQLRFKWANGEARLTAQEKRRNKPTEDLDGLGLFERGAA
jgi:hypothetical protein